MSLCLFAMAPHPAIVPGRVAVVSGAASGIGLAAATRFATLGMRVVLLDVNAAGVEAAAESIRQAGGDGTFQTVDWVPLRNREPPPVGCTDMQSVLALIFMLIG